MTEPISHLKAIQEAKDEAKHREERWNKKASAVDGERGADEKALIEAKKAEAYTFALKKVCAFVREQRKVGKNGLKCCPFCGSGLVSTMGRWMCPDRECILSRVDFDKDDIKKWNTRHGEITEADLTELAGE